MTILEILTKHNVPRSRGVVRAMEEYAAQETEPLYNKLKKANILLNQYEASVPRDTKGGGNYTNPISETKMTGGMEAAEEIAADLYPIFDEDSELERYLNEQFRAVHRMCASEILSTPEKYGLKKIDSDENHDSDLYISMLQGSEQNLRCETERLKSALEAIILINGDAWGYDEWSEKYSKAFEIAEEALKGGSK